MFKDEAGEKQIAKFVCLKSKSYSYKMFESSDETNKCKGVKQNVAKKNIIHESWL